MKSVNTSKFEPTFTELTGNAPFPWQCDLYNSWFSHGKFPASCNVPTGLGKTSVLAIWLIALVNGAKVPRRLVYVVNRRTVVDQTTDEAIKLRNNLDAAGIALALRELCALSLPDDEPPLAISTLRGQFADNRKWSIDPTRPAIISGTVDMIGSRLLFNGYGVGFRSKPLHAGFLGQATLLVHDEAHLEPAFQDLIETIMEEQKRCSEFARFHVTELTATTRRADEQTKTTFTLTADDRAHPIVKRRIEARKRLVLTSVEDDKQIVGEIAVIAAEYKDANAGILLFVRTLEAVAAIEKELVKTGRRTILLTGTMRGKERDGLVETREFKRFLKSGEPGETVYLICTSAGEVGIDISADHMVCDLSTYESMAQRFGRVNAMVTVPIRASTWCILPSSTIRISSRSRGKPRSHCLSGLTATPALKLSAA
jgi:CRISPR-associated endonuclease/helicase Cas3